MNLIDFKANYDNDLVCDLIEDLEKHDFFRLSILEELKEYLITTKNPQRPNFSFNENEAIKEFLSKL